MNATSQRIQRISARDMIDAVLDPGSFESWDTPADYSYADSQYASQLAAAAAKSGHDESVITGTGRIAGQQVAVVLSVFDFLAGSIGNAAADRIVAALHKATALGLPVLASPASGGTRMQEGTPAFVAMVRICAAVRAHKQASLPYLVYLRDPTTGGAMASWGTLGHITVAQPGALLGFLGPRVYETIYHEPFPCGVQQAENLYAQGLIDAVLPVEQLAEIVRGILRILAPATARSGQDPADLLIDDSVDRELDQDAVWRSVGHTRHPRRPGVRHVIKYAASDALQLSGTGQGKHDARMYLGLARFDGQPCVLVAQDRDPSTAAPLGAAFLREARRGAELASGLGLPLLTVIDTEGAALSKQAEEEGLAGQIARSISALIGLETPSVSLLLGQGTGGGALAVLPADITLAAEHAWLCPLPPEGASAILYRDTEHAAELAHAQKVDAFALRRAGIVERIIAEPEPATRYPRHFAQRIGAALAGALADAAATPAAMRAPARALKYASVR